MVTVQRWVPIYGMLLTATLLPYGVQARQLREAAQPDVRVLDLLAKAPAGTYLVNGRTIEPSTDADKLPVFVQADAYRRPDGGIGVPVAIGAVAPGAWAARLSITKPGTAGPAERAAETTLSGLAGAVRQTSQFTLEPGTYEIVLALAADNGGSGAVGSVLRQALTVPDLAAQTLTASPLVLGDAVIYVAGDGPGRPFVFGTTQLMPAARNQFRPSDQLHIACRVHGWKGDADAKPDLTVEYVFHEHVRDHLRFFNKTKAQELNAATVARSFDGKAGSIAVGMSVPLGAFPAGEFDVAVRIRDKRTQATTIRQATFVVRK